MPKIPSNVFRRPTTYHDSISHCSQPDFFSMIKNPYAAPLKKRSIDTIESTQVKLEKEAFEKFKANNFQLPNQKWMVVARVGKFIFIAVTLPAYLVLYSIPKWLVVNLIPKIFMRTKIFFLKGAQFLTNHIHFAHLLSFKKGAQLIGKKMMEYMSWVNSITQALFVHFKHQTIKLMDKFAQPLKEFLVRLHLVYIKGKETFTQVINKILTSFQNPFNKMATFFLFFQKIKIPRFENSKRIVDKAYEIAKSMRKKITKQIDFFSSKLGSAFQKIKSPFQNLLKTSFELASEAFKPIGAAFTPLIEGLRGRMLVRKEKVIKAIVGNVRPVQQKIHHFFVSVFQNAFSFLKSLQQWFQKLKGIKLTTLPPLITQWLKKKKEKKQFSLSKKIANLKSFVEKKFNYLLLAIKEKRNQAWQWLRNLMQKIYQNFKATPQMIHQTARDLVRKIKRGVIRLIYKTRVIIAWTVVLSKFGMQMVRETNQEIMSRFKTKIFK